MISSDNVSGQLRLPGSRRSPVLVGKPAAAAGSNLPNPAQAVGAHSAY